MSLRREKCTQKVIDAGLDGVLFATGANFQYLSECTDYFWQRACMNNIGGSFSAKLLPETLAYLNNKGECTIVTIPQYKDAFPGQKVVVSYMDQFEDTLSTIIDGKKIGIGNDCKDFVIETLKEVDPEISTEDVEFIFCDLMAIKDEEEIARMRKLAKFTDDAIMYVVTHLKEGMTQYEAEKMIMDYGLEHGIQDLSFPPTAGFKTRGTFTPEENFIFPRTSKLVPGTAIAFDVGYMDKGYCSDWGRTVYYGKAPEYVKNAYKALQAGQVYMVSKIVPNETKASDLYKYILEEVTRQGFDEVLRYKDTQMNGHQIGIDCHNHPLLKKEVDDILRPGMIFCSEPKMMIEGECYMRVEDMILVTETGAEFLTNFPRDLFEFNND
ncbi:MAG: aminopeptidase P family protein [Erysipelotrichales bacterium]|nr:aminopeptidase P family protein [Erysipelotrichales bacterium]